ncbi:hypothetical protein [Salinicola sp. DM10]|uniref:hypothetical protein n=1 Tax=Salinicola sp. DM10 TaxID=2815721 RepID=UPI001A8F6D70|nr:hypothetical protein [Salinicola sp. DM10]MCE3026391.1 hypothetical protein [Salinicola sp. DM10]
MKSKESEVSERLCINCRLERTEKIVEEGKKLKNCMFWVCSVLPILVGIAFFLLPMLDCVHSYWFFKKVPAAISSLDISILVGVLGILGFFMSKEVLVSRIKIIILMVVFFVESVCALVGLVFSVALAVDAKASKTDIAISLFFTGWYSVCVIGMAICAYSIIKAGLWYKFDTSIEDLRKNL